MSIRGRYSTALRDKTCETAENMVAFVKDLASRIGSIAPAFLERGADIFVVAYSRARGKSSRSGAAVVVKFGRYGI